MIDISPFYQTINTLYTVAYTVYIVERQVSQSPVLLPLWENDVRRIAAFEEPPLIELASNFRLT